MKVAIFHAEAGYGHKKVALMIEKALRAAGLPEKEVKVFDALELTSAHFRYSYPAIYFNAVKWIPKLWGWFYEVLDHDRIYPFLRPVRSCLNRLEGREWIAWVRKENPEWVVCCHFFTAEVFSRARKERFIQSKVLTVITDFAPHTFWVHEGSDYYWVMTEEAKTELIRRGIPAARITAGGIPVDPAFKPAGRKQEILREQGLENGRLTLLLTSGSFGLSPMDEILRAMEPFKDRVQAMCVTGNNKELKSKLEAMSFPFPVKIFGFVNFMPELMEAADLLVAKTGGATSVESLAKGLPLVIFQPIPGQETRNADYLRKRYASFSMEKPSQIADILRNIFEDPELLQQKKKVIAEIARPDSAAAAAQFILTH